MNFEEAARKIAKIDDYNTREAFISMLNFERNALEKRVKEIRDDYYKISPEFYNR